MPSPGYTFNGSTVELQGPGLSTATIHTHGATVTAWSDATGTPRLYLSPTAALDGSAPIRGGIPVCFPQFGPGARWPKQHGFARRLPWTVETGAMESGVPRAVLTLEESEQTKEGGVWAHCFLLRLVVEIGAGGQLLVGISVENRNEVGAFDFTLALHSYFNVTDVEKAKIVGLKGLSYRDNADGLKEKTEEDEAVAFAGEVDRCYIGAPNSVLLEGAGVVVEKEGLPELVTWNPYKEKTAALPDMPDGDWQKFVCAEPALVYPAASLEAGASYSASITLRAI